MDMMYMLSISSSYTYNNANISCIIICIIINTKDSHRVYTITSQLTITFIHMESASCELALKPSLYNNRPIHSKYFRAGNTRLQRTSNLAPGNTHFPRSSVSTEINTHVNHRVSGASLQAGLASGNSLHDSRCLPCGLRTILSYVPS